MRACQWEGQPGAWQCAVCGFECRSNRPLQRNCDEPNAAEQAEEFNPYSHLNCQFRLETDETIACRICGGRERTERVYLCQCQDVKQEKATIRKAKHGSQFAVCLGCRHAEE